MFFVFGGLVEIAHVVEFGRCLGAKHLNSKLGVGAQFVAELCWRPTEIFARCLAIASDRQHQTELAPLLVGKSRRL